MKRISKPLNGACSCSGGASTRRFFLGMMAATAVVTGTRLHALAATQDGIIDVHHHTVPPFWFDEVKDVIAAQGGGRIVPNWLGWSPQKAIAEMERNGVSTAILSISTPGIWFGDVAQARRLSRQCNEYAAQMIKDYPGKFGLFAALPLPDTEGSLAELAHAMDTLKADGIGLFTSYGDKWLGDPVYDRVFEELNRRKAVVYVHPATPSCCTKLMPHVPPFLTEFIQETNRAITSLVYSGTLSKYQDIKFIFSHAGGAIPTLTGRISQLAASSPIAAKAPQGFEHELRRHYFEIANSANPAAIAALTSVVPSTQILFGSDFPLVPLPATANGLAGLKFSDTEMQAIRRGNALTLLPRLK